MIRKLIVILLAVLLVLSCAIFVACDNDTDATGQLQYALTEDNTGYVVVDSSSVSGAVVVPDSYNNLPVVGISHLAFSKSSITSIVIPDSIAYIGNSAFWQCGSLTSVTIGNSVSTIGDYAFMDCTKLEKLTLGTSIISIGQLAFYGCNNLNAVYIVGGLDSWLNIDFANISANPMYYTSNVYLGANSTSIKLCDTTEVVATSSNTSINLYAFYNCQSIVSVDLADSVETISDYAFDSIDTLTTVSGADSVTHIGDYAFNGCTSLATFGSSSTLDYIGDYAFNGCALLTAFDLGGRLTYLGEYSFAYCSSLLTIAVPGTVDSIEQYCFYNCSALTEVNLSEGTTSICIWAFARTNIVAVSVPDSVVLLDSYAFAGCGKLQDIQLGSSIVEIGKVVFYNCKSIDSMTLPDSVESIGRDAFNGCTAMSSITFGANITSIGIDAFCDCVSLGIIYYNGSVADWCNISFGTESSNPMYMASVWYSLDNNGQYEVITDLVIPDEVTAINDLTFYSCKQLTSVTIGESVTSIGYYSFGCCENVEFLTLGNSVMNIGDYAFTYCEALAEVVMPESLREIGYRSFFACKKLVTLQLNEGLLSIGEGAFSWVSISTVTIPASVNSIGSVCFDRCDLLQYIYVADGNECYSSIDGHLYSKDGTAFYQYALANTATIFTIASNVVSVEARGFRAATYIQQFVVAEGNTTFCDVDGVLYTIDMNTLVRYPCGSNATTFTVPEGVGIIGDYSFAECKLQAIYLADSVTTIGMMAFYNMNYLTNVCMGSSVQAVGTMAFTSCEQLTEIFIPASLTQIKCQIFYSCAALTSITFEDSDNWYVTTNGTYTGGMAIDVSDSLLNAIFVAEYANSSDGYYLYKAVDNTEETSD